ncbi:hypothetical protein [Burkholderia stagnalis]|uniref:hypothetical protein n=1 Tax=Burkholderia stagnalis TaxID=1503054 RepID=UPI000A46A805|nr:hypothetical protein [Burkholderia stagnalis]
MYQADSVFRFPYAYLCACGKIDEVFFADAEHAGYVVACSACGDDVAIRNMWVGCETVYETPTRAVCARSLEECARLLGMTVDQLRDSTVVFNVDPFFGFAPSHGLEAARLNIGEVLYGHGTGMKTWRRLDGTDAYEATSRVPQDSD